MKAPILTISFLFSRNFKWWENSSDLNISQLIQYLIGKL